MPTKRSQRAEINSFVQGLITEATPLNFPDNASADEENFVLNRDGSRARRLGMDLEENFDWISSGVTTDRVSEFGYNTFKWSEVSGDVSSEYLVAQFDNRIYFFDIDTNSISRDGFLGMLTIPEFPAGVRFSFASIEGALVAVAGVDSFAVISYDGTTFSYYLDRIKIRDVFGIESGIPEFDEDISYRANTLPFSHYYNLQNQSWGVPKRTIIPLNNVNNTWDVDPILHYTIHYGFTPSNSEQVWLGMQFTPTQFNGESGQMDRPYEYMYVNLYKESWSTKIPPARGYFIIDALRRGQSRYNRFVANLAKYPELNKNPYTGFSQFFDPSEFIFPTDYTTKGASCVAEFAGRVFFSGFTGEVINGDSKSPNYSNYVFFSTLVKNKTDINKCYQEGDPTGRDDSDIVATDGGFLRISEAKEIHSLISLGSSLLVIATNGVWSIDGGSDYGFSATNYKVTKLSTFGGLSQTTVVTEGTRVYFWAADGIYMVGRNQLGDMVVESLTVKTIQELYDDIPSISKINASGVYDSFSKKIRWIYQDGDLLEENTSTYELILDTDLGAFSKYRIMNVPLYRIAVLGAFQSSPFRATSTEESVLVVGDLVYVDTDPVIITARSVTSSSFEETKYVSVKIENGLIYFTFSFYNNTRFLDWESVDGEGVDAKAYCLTGMQTAGDSGIDKQIPYLIFHFVRTEDFVDVNYVPLNQSSCLFRCQWNFANTVNSKQWTPLMQAYRYRKAHWAPAPLAEYDTGYEVITSKNKVRGRGKAFALYFETEPEKDCRVLGWSVTVNANSVT